MTSTLCRHETPWRCHEDAMTVPGHATKGWLWRAIKTSKTYFIPQKTLPGPGILVNFLLVIESLGLFANTPSNVSRCTSWDDLQVTETPHLLSPRATLSSTGSAGSVWSKAARMTNWETRVRARTHRNARANGRGGHAGDDTRYHMFVFKGVCTG